MRWDYISMLALGALLGIMVTLVIKSEPPQICPDYTKLYHDLDETD